MRFNLSAKVNTYPKISPSALINCVTEAPLDNNLYGRKDKEWVEIEQCKCRKEKIQIYCGESDKTILENFSDMESLPVYKEFLSANTYEIYINNYELSQVGYFWICCNFKVSEIYCPNVGKDLACYYTDNEGKIIKDNYGMEYYCYRLKYKLIADHPWNFKVIIE